MSSSGPSGRSPFAGRSRRPRTSFASEGGGGGEQDSNNNASISPFGPSGLLSVGGGGRTSPGWSPARRRRFFDSADRGGGVLGTALPAPLSKKSSQANSNNPGTGDGMDLPLLRCMTLEALGNGSSCITASPGMAVFYGSILYSKTLSAEDAYLYAQALALNGEHRRCVRLLDKANLLMRTSNNNFEAVLLAAQSLVALSEWEECQTLLEEACKFLDDEDDAAWDSLVASSSQQQQQEGEGLSSTKIHPIARLCLWRGRAYDETGHPTRASSLWKRALLIDSRCVEALDCMLRRSVVTPQEAHNLLSRLHFDPGMEWLRHMYFARLDLPQDVQKENKVPQQQQQQQQHQQPTNSFFGGQQVDASSIQHMTMTPSSGSVLVDNIWEIKEDDQKLPAKQHQQHVASQEESIALDVDAAFSKLWTVHKLHQCPEVLSLAAIRSYRRYNLPAALAYCQALYDIDPLCPTAAYVYVATLVGMKKKRMLFGLAHEWVEASPKAAKSWFAVGAYYYACERHHLAQRHFCRASRLDPQSTEAWIAFGCSFAACDESDQALASFRAAQRLAPAQHLSLLYMGMEYLRTNHLVLAQHFLSAALHSSGGDPLCFHELGVACCHKNEYKEAISLFSTCLRTVVDMNQNHDNNPNNNTFKSPKTTFDCIDLIQDEFWEPTLFNLGHCYRKTRQFAEAEHCYEKCLALRPSEASPYAALGFTKHLTGNLDGAIEQYHQALSRKPDDPFSSDMLNRALEEVLASVQITDADDVEATPASFASPTSFASPAAASRRFETSNISFATSEDDDEDMSMS